MKQHEIKECLRQEENIHKDTGDACSWSKLSINLLSEILRRLPSDDYLRFSAVCTSWHYAVEERHHMPAPQLPWLMIPDSETYDTMEKVVFLSLSSHCKYCVSLPIRGACCQNFIGSSCGWLITNDRYGGIVMFNPLNMKQVHLPPLTTFPDITIMDASHHPDFEDQTCTSIVMYDPASYGGNPSCEPRVYTVSHLSNNYFIKAIVIPTCPNRSATLVDGYTVVVVIEHGRIAIVRDGDTNWTIMNPQYSFPKRPHFSEIAYINGVVYALSDMGDLISWDFSTMTMKELTSELPEIPEFLDGTLFNLVELDGDLLVVDRFAEAEFTEEAIPITNCVAIHKFNWSTKSWDEVKSLGHYSIFVGINQALPFSTLDFPELKKNCIYFTDNEQLVLNTVRGMKRNMGVFDLKVQKMIDQYEGYDDRLVWPLPLWLYPNIIDGK